MKMVEKLYRDPDFMNSLDARPIRILAEYLGPASKFEAAKIRDTIVFFGSSRAKSIEEAKRALERAEKEGAGEEEIERARNLLKLAHYSDDARELAKRLTIWSKGLGGKHRRFVVCSGGGPGIMEAANRGASEARGETIGLNISIPTEQFANPFITRKLTFEFHYFFMRKYWFLYLAKALVIFPGGFGTLDELMEVLTLVQTRKVTKPIPIVVYGSNYWSQVINWDAMVKWGTIEKEDLDLFKVIDKVDEAFDFLTTELSRHYLGKQDNHVSHTPAKPPEP